MPDANKENTLNQLVGAAFGAAGQRCMALSTAILVGEARSWLPDLVERAKALRVNAGTALWPPGLRSGRLFLSVQSFRGGHPQRTKPHLSPLSPCCNYTARGLLSQPRCKPAARSVARTQIAFLSIESLEKKVMCSETQ